MREMDLGDLSFSPEEQELLQRMERGTGRRQVSRRRLWWAVAIGYIFVLALEHISTQLQNQPATQTQWARAVTGTAPITPRVRQQTDNGQDETHAALGRRSRL